MSVVESNPKYLLDADVFIQASREYYAFDIAPTFWEHLTQLASDGYLMSIDRVLKEINRGNDELKSWANDLFIDAFVSTDEPNVIRTFAKMMQWVQNQNQFSDAAKAEFASEKNADGWLIAYAKVNGLVVVTHEVYNQTIRRKVPIPNVCRAFNIQPVNTFEMMRVLGIRLV